jgi:hypothetical protein
MNKEVQWDTYVIGKYTYFLGYIFRLFFGDRLCGLGVRVPDYTSRCPGFDSRRYQIFWEVVGLERV